MIFEALDKIKRNAIFSTILFVALGAVIMICPQEYVPTLILGFGYVLVVIALVFMLDFIACKKSLMDYVKFVGAIALLIGGICILLFRENTVTVLAIAFAVMMMLDGIRTFVHSLTYSRRSHRRGWWLLTILSLGLVAVGVLLFINPWVSTPETALKAIGWALFFAAIVSGLRLIWTWPITKERKKKEEVVENA